jgi:hypothetical protein
MNRLLYACRFSHAYPSASNRGGSWGRFVATGLAGPLFRGWRRMARLGIRRRMTIDQSTRNQNRGGHGDNQAHKPAQRCASQSVYDSWCRAAGRRRRRHTPDQSSGGERTNQNAHVFPLILHPDALNLGAAEAIFPAAEHRVAEELVVGGADKSAGHGIRPGPGHRDSVSTGQVLNAVPVSGACSNRLGVVGQRLCPYCRGQQGERQKNERKEGFVSHRSAMQKTSRSAGPKPPPGRTSPAQKPVRA